MPSPDFFYQRDRIDLAGQARSDLAFPGLGQAACTALPFRPLNICIITQDFVGPVLNGGIGTAYMYAARALSEAGHKVTVFYCSKSCVNETLEYWRDFYAKRHIEFIPADDIDVVLARGPMTSVMRLPYMALDWLKTREMEFDIVHVSEWSATGYLCLQAKCSGLHFQKTRFVVKCSSPLLWNRMGNAETIADVRSLSTMFMERRCVEMADYVICGSRYLLNWMVDQGYALPHGRTYVQPNVFPVGDIHIREGESRIVEVEELVFFGRLESRKGIHFFVDALVNLKADGFFDGRQVPRVTLLGKVRKTFKLAPLIERLQASLGIEVTVYQDKSQPAALDYLKAERGRVAVMPSLMDNSPFGVYECLAKAIPFVTSSAGGGRELIAEADWPDVVFEASPNGLACCLRSILENGCPLATASFDFEKSLSEWLQWHLWAADQPASERRAGPDGNLKKPLVSVCIAHHNRGALLRNALESVLKQTYRNLEIVIVDDGSTDGQSIKVLADIEKSAYSFPVSVVRQDNRYLGAVRNSGIAQAKGDYILFMDDDNEAKPEEVATFVKVAGHTEADVLTCCSDTFVGFRPDTEPDKSRRIIYQGENLAMALMLNPFGDSNCFVRREAVKRIGGFSEYYKVGMDDLEFFVRAYLSGLKIFMVPEALYWYRINQTRMRQSQYSRYAGRVRVLEPLTQGMQPEIANLLRYASGMCHEHGQTTGSAANPKGRIKEAGRRVVGHSAGLEKLARRVYHRLFNPQR
ncbi:glycosyltransferase [Microbulbifer sp. 2201CG32-9]|uniref:glycosyltransferase n=1 Tax=Microbulbifer sp. 2201CG32-9 TaxID=3232309 RepID=UPI00345B80EF